MSLSKYKEKRSFEKTSEPTGGKAGTNELRFVVQKHAASHLHYDFRLEMRGVLKSWAVPKGPSLDTDIKRLAMMVEDHPYDYRMFEGIIPKGQYGGGTVIVWDEGTYAAAEIKSADKKEHEKNLLKQLYGGKIKFRLNGKKLKGEFALVKAPGRGENAWLLMKMNDRFASKDDILKKDKSVLSNKTIEQVTATSTNIYGQTKKPAEAKTAIKTDIQAKAKKTPFPAGIQPMLATLVDRPVDEEGWLYEIKWDGYRALALMNKGETEIISRNKKSFNEKFYPVYKEMKGLKLNAVVDGEIVVTNDKGLSDFGSLQNWRSEADGELIFYLFDILWLNGNDLTSLPLTERKAILKQTIRPTDTLRISENFEASGSEFFEAAKKMGLEGIIAKKMDSQYFPGARSTEWLKIKSNKRQEAVIGGFTRNENSSKLFSSLLVGVYKNGVFEYTGKIGTGFTDKLQKELMLKFKSLIIKKCPFSFVPDINKPSRFRPNPPKAVATWLKPRLVCEVSFTEMTSDGVMRHPSFEGMRIDKNPADVVEETEVPAEAIQEHQKLTEKKIITPAGKKVRKTLLNPTDETQVRNINGHELKFTNLSKIFWPKEKVTKRDLINYYYQVAPYMLPYLVDRPQSLNRHPNGINGISFYQKDVTGKVPAWIQTFPYYSEADEQQKNFLVCSNEASLLYMASLGCIEINPWSSRVQSPGNPDWCIIDLDPDKNSFNQVIEAAQVTKKILDAAGAPSYCKTSGSTGLHIYIPLGAKYTYEQSKELGRAIAKLVHRELPKFTSIERAVVNRKGKMYIDFLQNRPQATLAAPYSLRPKPGATVSTPLHWEEVKKGLQMKDFTIFNVPDRLKNEGDIFKKVIGRGINLPAIEKKLAAL